MKLFLITLALLISIIGCDGKDGERGLQGIFGDTGVAGLTGPSGIPGSAGAPGSDGAPGSAGAPGSDGTLTHGIADDQHVYFDSTVGFAVCDAVLNLLAPPDILDSGAILFTTKVSLSIQRMS